eukprot:TRINITY_DN20722_c0_g2_i1.p1 TRINITY_DN20722_c0_g2~~TRINITY_DN20722_c0_g2_i1.p1  ORF type:complete len:122 (+),score=43.87 TRINITY_DN20722_c0_g2_i1:125-490(+)
MTTQASADLIWRVVKGNNAFLRKQRIGRGSNRIALSAEPLNLTSKSTFKYSGVAHKNAIGMELTEGGIVVTKGKKSFTRAVKKARGLQAKGRKDLKTAIRAKAQRLNRLTTRKTRKTWKQE